METESVDSPMLSIPIIKKDMNRKIRHSNRQERDPNTKRSSGHTN